MDGVGQGVHQHRVRGDTVGGPPDQRADRRKHTIRATFEGDERYESSSATISVDVAKAVVVPVVVGLAQVQANHAFELTAGLTGDVSLVPATGVISIKEGDATVATGNPYGLYVTLPGRAVGTYSFGVTYDGDANYFAATGQEFVVIVVPDVVEAASIGLQYPTFYPYRDGYRDTVAVKGVRSEPIAVTAAIYNSDGRRVKVLSSTQAVGPYSMAWNGRNSAGKVLSAGTYKVVQTLRDAAGTTKQVTGYVRLSGKRLVIYTKTLSKLGSAISARGHGTTGSVAVSPSAGYVKLTPRKDYAVAGWEFAIPSATVYKSIKFRAYAKAVWSTSGSWIALQNFTSCARSSRWDVRCFDHEAGIGNQGTLSWYTTKGSISANRSGRYVRGLALVQFATGYVYKVQVVVTYGVLK